MQRSKPHLFDYLVSGDQEGRRRGQAERLGGLLVDDELEPGRFQHGQIAWGFTLEYPADVNALLAQRLRNARSVAQEKPGARFAQQAGAR